MAERMNRFPEVFKGRPGYEGYLSFRVAALPEIMQDNGYFTIMDILPTVLDLAGIEHPGKKFRGRQIAPVRGKSWRPLLESTHDAQITLYDAERDMVGWEQLGIAAVRVGQANGNCTICPPIMGTSMIWRTVTARNSWR